MLALGAAPPRSPADVVVLDRPRDVDEYARVLYARLREADDAGLDVVLAVAPPADGRRRRGRRPAAPGVRRSVAARQ